MSVLPQDETGKAEHGYDYDFEMAKTVIYVDDGAGGVEIWDGTADFGGDVEIDTDALETICERIAVATEIMDDWDDGGDRANINLPDSVNIAGLTTTTPLNSGVSWTGTGESTLPYKSITIVCFADQDSAADGLQLQWSADNSNWEDHTAEYTYTASTDFSIGASVRAGWFRVKYTNGGTNQGVFRLYTFMHTTQADTNIRPLSFAITDNESGPMVRAVLAAKKPNAAYANIEATAGGNLKVSIEEQDASAGLATDQTLLDNLDHYKFYAWEVDSSIYYVGYQTKEGAWYAKKIDPSAGTCEYDVGASSPPTAANLSAQSYGAFADKF